MRDCVVQLELVKSNMKGTHSFKTDSSSVDPEKKELSEDFGFLVWKNMNIVIQLFKHGLCICVNVCLSVGFLVSFFVGCCGGFFSPK